MRVEDFPCHPYDNLKDIRLNGKLAESVTYDFDKKHIKQKNLVHMLVNDNRCFIASTQEKKPTIRFKPGKEVDIESPFIFETNYSFQTRNRS